MSSERIFIAIDISNAARSVCSNHINELRHVFPDVRVGWEHPEKLHLTLEFLGQVEAPVLNQLQLRLSEVASRHKSFNAGLSSTGAFPSRSRARILWIGIDDESRAVGELYSEVRAICGSLGFKTDVRSFKPHVTVGRLRETRGSAELVSRHLKMEIEPVRFEVLDIVIYESILQPTGSVYSVVSKEKLHGAPKA